MLQTLLIRQSCGGNPTAAVSLTQFRTSQQVLSWLASILLYRLSARASVFNKQSSLGNFLRSKKGISHISQGFESTMIRVHCLADVDCQLHTNFEDLDFSCKSHVLFL